MIRRKAGDGALDETFVDLGDRTTPQRGPIPRFV
jgi:hypothetical protein